MDDICGKDDGQCLCKDGFGGERCDRCVPGWFGFPDCQPCNCTDVGSGSEICDEVNGQCPCLSNYGGRTCDECSAGYFKYPDCQSCGCDSMGSKGISCDDQGICNCKSNFVGGKCDQCAPERYNYPLCEECNCNPDGVTEDFFAQGGCDSVPEGSLCTCKEKVTGRICDRCKPLYWNLQGWNPQGCEDCLCNREGTVGAIGICDLLDGQCACKPHVGKGRTCNECKDGFFGMSAVDAFGCQHCRCDVGGTQLERGEMAVCDKDNGQCRCRPGMIGRRCDEVQKLYYLPTLHQFQYEIEDGYRTDDSPVRIGYNDAVFPGYSWRGYGAYSQLQNEVLLDVPVTSSSVHKVILRFTNPNPTPVNGEVTLTKISSADKGDAAADDPAVSEVQSHVVVLPPTGGQPTFATVSGDKNIYASLYDLDPGTWTASIKLDNSDPEADEVLVDYFVMLPHEYYEPTILKGDVYDPCLAGEKLPLCRQYSYPDISAHPQTQRAQRPGGATDIYAWEDRPDILNELGSRRLASIAKWQPQLEYPLDVRDPGKHVLAVGFFTPEQLQSNGSVELLVKAGPEGGEAAEGRAYIFNCKYSTLCRQVVTDDQGRIMEFDLDGERAKVELQSGDEDTHLGIDSIIAIPLDEWSLDFVTPQAVCVKQDGQCLPEMLPDAPDQSVIVPFKSADAPVRGDDVALPSATVPAPGLYVLIAQYNQQTGPEDEIKMNITYNNPGEGE